MRTKIFGINDTLVKDPVSFRDRKLESRYLTLRLEHF